MANKQKTKAEQLELFEDTRPEQLELFSDQETKQSNHDEETTQS